MINRNDLYDITFALIIIRNNIREKLNSQILSQMVKVLEEENSTEDNQIRKAISSIEGLDYEHWFFVYHSNVYVHHQILYETYIYDLLVKIFDSLICELSNEEFDKAYDLADSFHCLPEIIADNNFKIPKSFWKTFVKYYRDKWDKDFLRIEQKDIYKKSNLNISEMVRICLTLWGKMMLVFRE